MKQLLFLSILTFSLLYAKSDFIYETREEVVAYTGPIKETHRSSIQDAIDNAKEGSIIKLKAGIYEGNIVITKPISIIGTEEGVIIDGMGVGSVITVKSSYVTLKNLTIQNSGERSDVLDAAINMTGNTTTGALVQNEVSQCKILDSLLGINMEIVNNSLIKNNYITSKNYELGLRGDGIRLWYSNDNMIQKNHLYRSRDMVVWYSHGNTIEENLAEHGRYSLHFMYAGKNFVHNNVFQYNSVGIFFMYSNDTIATGNVITNALGATGIGIGLKDSSNFTIENNTIVYNAQGMYIDRSPFEPDSHLWIRNNQFLFNSEALHFHSLCENGIFENNVVKGNIEDVVNDSRSSDNFKNEFTKNYWDNYEGFDTNMDGYGDNPYRVYQYADKLWAYNPSVKFFYGSPVMTLLNFLSKLAPFSEPIFLLEDKQPKFTH
ncbi:nitrous oxidase accessory protein NosD [Sulfurospirillum diekertiae]|uniref:Nitrous oxidase accessory protein NosD n=1 Tax=Sulfurospirillum diekertiae TaxID=1854492 RepID=A0A290HTY2_9BACT|nr:nitrous oxide reductase family maturation protein NosD [Sulfurospirillum diekertiae]ATB69110.1 nitrous oxidase accessory protein NosD [Sulfurospirillum diekertiae]